MPKEMLIVFVYDTARCRREEDDPAEAVLYFHPTWVSPTQRLVLAGQLMGVNDFLTASFSPPRLITLQGGKFVLKKFGQYMLAVGTDRNIQDWILEKRADTLESLLKFFHRDLETVSASLDNDRNKLAEKLYRMFETYLPILQYGADIFSNIPNIKLPKSASTIFQEGIQVLQYCRQTNGIMGGSLFYNNKVIATQLDPDLTKQLIIADPYRVKVPAEEISVEFHLPIGVQLLRVYIEQRQIANLAQRADSEYTYNMYSDPSRKKTTLKKSSSKGNMKDLPSSGMKRDTSRIFTVPEEGELESAQCSTSVQYSTSLSLPLTTCSSPIKRKQEAKTDRPKHSNISTTSVCSTPLKDVNRVLLGTAVSICSTGEDTSNGTEFENKIEETKENTNDVPNVVKEAVRWKRTNKLKIVTSKEKSTKRIRDPNRKSSSASNLYDDTRKLSNCVTVRYYNIGLPRLNDNLHSDCDADYPQAAKLSSGKQFFNTITDPYYPVFRYDGIPVSRALYDQYIASHYQELHSDTSSVTNCKANLSEDRFTSAASDEAVTIEGFDSQAQASNADSEPKSIADVKLDKKNKQEVNRRSMSLPLKSLGSSNDDGRRKSTSECIFDPPQRRKLDGLQLTPLMSKLSLIADERSSGFCSRETTPGEFRDASGFMAATNQLLVKDKLDTARKECGNDEDDESNEDCWMTVNRNESSLEQIELFICGYQNMVMMILMEDGTGNNPDLIHYLWKTCVSTLGRLETRLQQCLEPLPSNENKELYSVLNMDHQWDTIDRSGLWGVTELEIVSLIHQRFTHTSDLANVIVRTEDTVVYGNQSGKTEVFYQQAMAPNTPGGLPTPADLMGVVPLKAKRRLERDHGIVLL